MANAIIKAIKRRRKELGLSQLKLAQAAGMWERSVWRLELGQCKPKASTLAKLSEALANAERTGFRPADIRPRRLALNLTAAALAREAKITPEVLRNIETLSKHKRWPWPATLQKIKAAIEEMEKNPRGPKLRASRLARGLSMEDLANIAGVSSRTILAIEHGYPTWPRVWEKIERALANTKEVSTGPQIRERRQSLGLTQEELAKRAKTFKDVVSAFERSDGPSAIGKTESLAKRLDIALLWFENRVSKLSFSSGPELKQARLAAGVGFNEFARQAGITPGTLWRYEKGDTQSPFGPILRAFEDVLSKAKGGQLRSGHFAKRLYGRTKAAPVTPTPTKPVATTRVGRRGPMPSNATATIYRECYERMTRGESLKQIITNLRREYGCRHEFTLPKTPSDVSKYAMRYAKVSQKPWPIPRPQVA